MWPLGEASGTDDEAATDAISALDRGDVALAVKLLRANPKLSKSDIEMLADMLDPQCDPGPFRPYELVLKRRKPGHPAPDPIEAREITHERISAVVRALHDPKSKGRLKNALIDAAEELGVSVPTVKAAWQQRRRLGRFKQQKICNGKIE